MVTGDEALTCLAETSSTSFSASSVTVSGLFPEDIESGLRPALPNLRDGIVSSGGGIGLLPLPQPLFSICLNSLSFSIIINNISLINVIFYLISFLKIESF